MTSKAMTMDAATSARLHNQLVKLGDMMGDGLHHEPGGKWIVTEYRRTMRALGHSLPRCNNGDAINRAMAERLKTMSCPKCGGALKQTRSGSKRAKCGSCAALFQFVRKAKGRAQA